MLYQRELAEGGNYDLIVCGGGFSGCAAAYAAAREGQRVLLVERGGCLGGVGTAGLVNDILGQRRHENGQLCQSVGGIFDQLERRLLAGGHAVDTKTVDPEHNPHGWLAGLASGVLFDNEYMKAFLEDMLDEVGVELLYHTDVLDVVRTGNRIEGVVIYNKSGLQLLRAIAFVDATGDGDVATLAGVPVYEGASENEVAEGYARRVGEMCNFGTMYRVGNVDYDRLFDFLEKHPYNKNRNHRYQNHGHIIFIAIPLRCSKSPLKKLCHFFPQNY